jgi:hypothetical protein
MLDLSVPQPLAGNQRHKIIPKYIFNALIGINHIGICLSVKDSRHFLHPAGGELETGGSSWLANLAAIRAYFVHMKPS